MIMMKESIRCCISCILPCGALDVIRIVHVTTGRVEEISRHSVYARDILLSNPKHAICGRPTPANPDVTIVPPDAELHRGKIYFLIPVNSAPSAPPPRRSRKKRAGEGRSVINVNGGGGLDSLGGEDRTRLLSASASDRYLSEILSEKVSTVRERRRGRVGVWRPHLESIEESGSDLEEKLSCARGDDGRHC